MTMLPYVLGLGVLAISLMLYLKRRGRGISLLIPFQSTDRQRRENVEWLKKYWHAQLPGAEIIIGQDRVSLADPQIPFSKSAAVNDAARRANGDIFVIVDGDGYVDAEAVLNCINNIRRAKREGKRLWYIPYRQFYRLTKDAARRVLDSSPKQPYRFPMPPAPEDVQETSGAQLGHWYGAMIQILSREAFWEVGGWDERFRGWGGEDHAAMRATDTLYWPHKTMPVQVLHLWHPMLTVDSQADWVIWKDRVWKNHQTKGANDALSGRYYWAHGKPEQMRKLVNESRTSYRYARMAVAPLTSAHTSL